MAAPQRRRGVRVGGGVEAVGGGAVARRRHPRRRGVWPHERHQAEPVRRVHHEVHLVGKQWRMV